MKIVSGGQAGADRAALDAAIEAGFETGGFIPRGRWAEDGPISTTYIGLEECDSPDPSVRTRLNVENSDATLIFSHGKLEGGSELTRRIARTCGKPCLHVDLLSHSDAAALDKVLLWIKTMRMGVLNVAGPRASKDPQIYDAVRRVLAVVFSKL